MCLFSQMGFWIITKFLALSVMGPWPCISGSVTGSGKWGVLPDEEWVHAIRTTLIHDLPLFWLSERTVALTEFSTLAYTLEDSQLTVRGVCRGSVAQHTTPALY